MVETWGRSTPEVSTIDLERRAGLGMVGVDDLAEEERRAIKVVWMDMWEACCQVVRKKLSHAA
jgi:transposase